MPSPQHPPTAEKNVPPGSATHQLLCDLRHQVRNAIDSRLRWQAAAAVALFGWLALIVDRLLEPSAAVRFGFGIVLVTAGLAWLTLVAFPRLTRTITDQQVLTLLHRDHPREVALISTALDVGGKENEEQNKELTEAIQASADQAATRLGSVRLVRPPAAMASVGFASVAFLAAIGFALARPEMAVCFAKRIALSEVRWPRRVELVAEGFEWDADLGVWTRVVARGEPLGFTVFANVANGQPPPRTLWARNSQGRRTTALTRVGQPEVGEKTRQAFRQRIERLDRDLQLAVRGGDGSLSLRLIAADRPRLTGLKITATPPHYLGEAETVISLATFDTAPEGSQLALTASSTKPLASIVATAGAAAASARTDLSASLDVKRHRFVIETPALTEATVVTLTATDADGLVSDPLGLTVEIAKDQTPTAGLTLDGVGRAVTRDARVPVLIAADDDHGVRALDLVLTHQGREITAPLQPPEKLPAILPGEFDLLSMRSATSSKRIALQPGDRFELTARVSDHYDLSERAPAESRPIAIEIVTPAELLARIGDAQRELRQSVEGLLADVQRLAYELDLRQRRDSADPSEDRDNWTAERLLDARKATDGIAAAAERAEGLRAQVVNNRLDQPALVDRLERQVAGPMQRLVEEELALARDALQRKGGPAIPTALLNVRKAAEVLQRVATSLETQQTYNEVVALLRGLIREQRRVNQQTERQEGESVRSLFD